MTRRDQFAYAGSYLALAWLTFAMASKSGAIVLVILCAVALVWLRRRGLSFAAVVLLVLLTPYIALPVRFFVQGASARKTTTVVRRVQTDPLFWQGDQGAFVREVTLRDNDLAGDSPIDAMRGVAKGAAEFFGVGASDTLVVRGIPTLDDVERLLAMSGHPVVLASGLSGGVHARGDTIVLPAQTFEALRRNGFVDPGVTPFAEAIAGQIIVVGAWRSSGFDRSVGLSASDGHEVFWYRHRGQAAR